MLSQIQKSGSAAKAASRGRASGLGDYEGLQVPFPAPRHPGSVHVQNVGLRGSKSGTRHSPSSSEIQGPSRAESCLRLALAG